MKKTNKFCGPFVEPDSPRFPPKLDLYMPATPPLGILAHMEFWAHILLRRYHFKKLFRPVLQQKDEPLEGIGYSREEITWAMQLPLNVDALKALEACRRERNLSLQHTQTTHEEPLCQSEHLATQPR